MFLNILQESKDVVSTGMLSLGHMRKNKWHQ